MPISGEDAGRAAIRRDFEREQYERADQQVPRMIKHDEAAAQAREYLDGSHPIPVDIGRALLAGYEADCSGCMHEPGIPEHYPCCVCRRMFRDNYRRGPEPSKEDKNHG